MSLISRSSVSQRTLMERQARLASNIVLPAQYPHLFARCFLYGSPHVGLSLSLSTPFFQIRLYLRSLSYGFSPRSFIFVEPEKVELQRSTSESCSVDTSRRSKAFVHHQAHTSPEMSEISGRTASMMMGLGNRGSDSPTMNLQQLGGIVQVHRPCN